VEIAGHVPVTVMPQPGFGQTDSQGFGVDQRGSPLVEASDRSREQLGGGEVGADRGSRPRRTLPEPVLGESSDTPPAAGSTTVWSVWENVAGLIDRVGQRS
jgi:hypothetical protein